MLRMVGRVFLGRYEATRLLGEGGMGKVYLDWAAFPIAETEILQPESDGVKVHLYDMRYAYPDRTRSLLGAFVVLDPKLHVVEQGMGRRSEGP